MLRDMRQVSGAIYNSFNLDTIQVSYSSLSDDHVVVPLTTMTNQSFGSYPTVQNMPYPLSDIYNHLDPDVSSSEGTASTSSGRQTDALGSKHHHHSGHTHQRRPITPPPLPHHRSSYSDEHVYRLRDGPPISLLEASGIQEHFSVPHKHHKHPLTKRPPPLPVGLSSDEEGGDDSRASEPSALLSSKFSGLPKIVTESPFTAPPLLSVSPPDRAHLGSRWSPDSSVMGSSTVSPIPMSSASMAWQDPRSSEGRTPLETHLEFVSSMSPVLSRGGLLRGAGQSGEGMKPKVRTAGDDAEADDEGGATYDTESTLSLVSSSGADSEDFEADVSAPDQDVSAEDYFGAASGSRTRLPESSGFVKTKKKVEVGRKARYTHGLALQRMPGKVKGFGNVPHYHHKVHRDRIGSRTKLLLKRKGSRPGSPFKSPHIPALSGRSSSLKNEIGMGEEGDAVEEEDPHQEDAVHNLGLAFVNLNLSETGRDVRVLVRSKQMKAKAQGEDLMAYDRIIDDLLVEEPMLFEDTDDQYHRKLVMYPREAPRFMIKRLPLSSSELLVILELNQSDLKSVSWNPAPRVICAIDRPRTILLSDKGMGDSRLGRPDDDVFVFFEPLQELDKHPLLETVEEYLEMFKELLEGLTFLHEQHIAGFRCNLLRSFMRSKRAIRRPTYSPTPVEPLTPSSAIHASHLRYHFVDFAEAHRILPTVVEPGSTAPPSRNELVEKDVKDLGVLFQSILDMHVLPEVSARFAPLVRAMTRGTFSADEARVFFMEIWRNMELEVESCEEKEGLPERKKGNGNIGKVLVGSMKAPEMRVRSTSSEYDVEVEGMEGDRPRFYYESGENSEDPNEHCDEEDLGKTRKAVMLEEETERQGQGSTRSGTITAKFAVPGLSNARLTYAEILPESFPVSVEKN
ncbi:hypothetical protein D9611_007363 [Ephemerocybe angulata]|uniref:Uncharacterized protein n=1 Tax=Ephemerocybe angulata TaxID=980116 RepID=A0A8H5CF76_9AGAR|nr:hypothetical protein D9611_007363 [Tulosesus angulatus]